MDKMQLYELQILLENIGYTYKQEWDASRLIAYCALSSFGTPKKSFDKFFPLPIDKTNTYEVRDFEVNFDDIKKIEEKMKNIQDIINKNGNAN